MTSTVRGAENVASASAARPPRAGLAQVILLLAGSCMPVLGSVLITPILPQLSTHFAGVPGADVLVPMVVATPALMVAVFAPFAGQIVDLLGRKMLLIIAMVAYAILGTAPLYLDGLPAILVSRLLVGVCEAAIMTVCTTLIVDYFHEARRRNRYLGLQTVVTSLAATAFIAIGGALGGGGWRTPFWVYLVSLVIAVPMLFLLWEPKPELTGEAADAHDAASARIPWRRLVAPLLVTLFGGFSFYVLLVELSYLLVGAGIAAENTAAIGGIAAAASLCTATGGLLFPLLKRVLGARLLPVAFGLQGIGFVFIWLVPALPGLVPGALVGSFGAGLLLPGLVTWVVARAGFAERGRVTGWWTAAFFLGQFLTPILVGVLAGAVGALGVAVGIIGVVTLGMAAVSAVVARESAA